MAHNRTQAQLAEEAGVNTSTVHRLESGHRIHPRNLEEICTALSQTVEFVSSVLPYGAPETVRSLFVHRNSDLDWYASGDRRKRIPTDNHRQIQRDGERLRLGKLGFARSFQAYMLVMPNGPSMSRIEIFEQVNVAPNPAYKDCILVCAQGRIIFRAQDQAIELSQGDSIGFSTDQEATIEPMESIDATGFPPVVMVVTANRRGTVPLEYQNRKRARTRHKAS